MNLYDVNHTKCVCVFFFFFFFYKSKHEGPPITPSITIVSVERVTLEI